jgi:hypothetical protein
VQPCRLEPDQPGARPGLGSIVQCARQNLVHHAGGPAGQLFEPCGQVVGARAKLGFQVETDRLEQPSASFDRVVDTRTAP